MSHSESPFPFVVGETFSRRISFDTDGIRQFATLAGDLNPLHHDAAFAARSRFGGLIASGTQTTSVMMGALAAYVCAKSEAVGLGFRTTLRRAVHPDQPMTVTWTVTAIRYKESLGGDIVTFSGEMTGADGQTYISADCENLVFRRVP